jgi:GNAT superfamily N-acetyltransferase
MNHASRSFDGPRLMHRGELIAMIRLSHLCFGGPQVIENEEQILAGYIPPRRGGTYVIIHEGKPVSQIGVFHDQIKMYDGKISTGSIGGVCTHPDYRGQGLAGRLLEHCTNQMVSEGARLMLISGEGPLYTRAGNVLQGKYMYVSMKPEQGNPWRSTPTDLVLRKATPADAALCSQLYQAEPVHFVRKLSDFAPAVRDAVRNNYISAEPWIIECAGQAMAYLFLGIPWGETPDSGIRHIGEYAGSRVTLADAIPLLMNASHLKELIWQVPWQDVDLIQLLEGSGYHGQTTYLYGHTLRIVNFPGFMADLRPLLQARVDAKLLRGLHFEWSGPPIGGTGNDRYAIRRGPDRLELDGAAMTLLVMGNADPQAEPVHAPGALEEIISALFPLPSFLPGLNYH